MSGDDPTETRQMSVPDGELMLVVMGPTGPASFPLPPSGEVVVGRAHDAFVRIDHPSVSRHHCSIHLGAGPRSTVEVEDAGSKNGTRLGGVPLPAKSRRLLPAGALLEVGEIAVLLQRARDASAFTQSRTTGDSVSPVSGAEPTHGKAMEKIYAIARRIAPDDVSVLILGETGVGKEVMAETLHRHSHRHRAPFLRLHCAAVSETLFESELFGHEKGSFTGAIASRPGLLETAAGGTVFIDEVGELPLSIQVKLLRVLEERSVRRVGGRVSTPIDVRFVAATNRDLEVEVAAGTFRQDLYFRLSGFTIRIPALRERPDEIEKLFREFVREACEERKRTPPTITQAVIDTLCDYPWPGNMRELKQVVVRSLLIAPADVLDVDHLPLE